MRVLRVLPVAVRMIAIAVAGIAATAAATAALSTWLQPWAAAAIAAVAVASIVGTLIWRALVPMRALFRALAGTVASYRDGDFSFGITWDKASDLIELVDAHNALGTALREQRLALVQRELLLDTMVQNTPVSMVLVDAAHRVVLGNLAARRMLGEGRRLEGRAFEDVLASTDPAVREAFERGGDGMFTVGDADDEDIYHLARRSFRLNGRIHELVLLRQLTAELRRQEVQTWKKVIRVISHELNNSLAPIRSPRSPIPAPNCCAAARPRACRKRWPPSRIARATWKASSAITRASPSCRRRAASRWNGGASPNNCAPRWNSPSTCNRKTASPASTPRRWSRRCSTC